MVHIVLGQRYAGHMPGEIVEVDESVLEELLSFTVVPELPKSPGNRKKQTKQEEA